MDKLSEKKKWKYAFIQSNPIKYTGFQDSFLFQLCTFFKIMIIDTEKHTSKTILQSN